MMEFSGWIFLGPCRPSMWLFVTFIPYTICVGPNDRLLCKDSFEFCLLVLPDFRHVEPLLLPYYCCCFRNQRQHYPSVFLPWIKTTSDTFKCLQEFYLNVRALFLLQCSVDDLLSIFKCGIKLFFNWNSAWNEMFVTKSSLVL